MLKHALKRRTSSLLLALVFTPALFAQAPSPNADILKMLQAGLPESTIVNKINQGHWDTSVDALIALKQAGATDAEITALTKPFVTSSHSPTEPEPIPVLGGTVFNHNGNVTFVLPSSQDAGTFPLNFRIVLIDGSLALQLSTEGVYEPNSDKWLLSYGDLIFQKQRVSYYPYIDAGLAHTNPFPTWTASKTTDPIVFPATAISPVPFTILVKDSQPVSEDYAFVDGRGYFEYRDFWTVTNLYPKKSYPSWGFRLGDIYNRSSASEAARYTADLILHDFDRALSQILQAAGIQNPMRDLSPASHFQSVTLEQLTPIITARNAAIQQRQQDYKLIGKKARHMESDSRDGGGSSLNGFLAFTNAMQGFANMQAAVQQGHIAAVNHDMAGQMQAALNAGTAEINTIQAVTDTSTTLQPMSSSQSSIQSTTNQQLASIQAAKAHAAAAQAAQRQATVAQQQTAAQQAAVAQQAAAQKAAQEAANLKAQQRAAQQAAAAQAAQAKAASANSCHGMNDIVHLQSEWFPYGPKDNNEVVGYFTNNSTSGVTCVYAFHKNGQWTDIGTGYYKEGATHQGGQGGGIWEMGADSSDMKYACFEGSDPVGPDGKHCTTGVVFSGPTSAGSDLRDRK